eukprot:5115823-Pleurochrysis_carterae.AAC.3
MRTITHGCLSSATSMLQIRFTVPHTLDITRPSLLQMPIAAKVNILSTNIITKNDVKTASAFLLYKKLHGLGALKTPEPAMEKLVNCET